MSLDAVDFRLDKFSDVIRVVVHSTGRRCRRSRLRDNHFIERFCLQRW